CLLLYGGTVLF
nr:immunoglobulin light chain junction region [Macaca mulatta]MPN65378.1 immunoglobulin light chain junction region [Macaca mulatta]MPN65817.1 immunoglobulin light chain junction region [Macaca mulatta]MPN65889.1 immunoglobulin light chain junction region [Macaca mulatta]MPN65928.1 immunoglobulin light chain junction region [Macaca mulatta]